MKSFAPGNIENKKIPGCLILLRYLHFYNRDSDKKIESELLRDTMI